MLFLIVVAALLVLLSLVAYAAWYITIKPAMERAYFRKFSKVYVNPNASLVAGDLPIMHERYVKKNQSMFLHFGDSIIEHPNKDMALVQLGSESLLLLAKPLDVQEFIRLSPHLIDNDQEKVLAFHRLFLKASSLNPTSSTWSAFREGATRSVQFNKASQYLPLIFEEAKVAISEWKNINAFDF